MSNILGVVLTPLLVVLLMHTSGAPRVDATATPDIVLQLLLGNCCPNDINPSGPA